MRRDFSQPPKRSKKRFYIAGLIMLVIVIGFFVVSHNQDAINESATNIIKKTQPAFPTISTKGTDSTQREILRLVKEEYEKAPRSYDATVLKYTEGNRESWCTDFISWVYSKAGMPLTNPNSGYWRIPGVLTLQQYYRDTDRYIEASTDYTPKLGDIAFYIGAQTPDNSSDEHAALVLKIDGDNITTIGGNEGIGVMRIRTESLQENIDKSLVGFGVLKK